MVRPCFLVIDPEFPGSISTRKLVIETAKFNVITAYSGREAVETLRAFPAIHGIVMNEDIHDLPCHALVAAFKEVNPIIPVIVISGPKGTRCPGADYQLDSFEPRVLLDLLAAIMPLETEGIERHEERLEEDDENRRKS